MVSFSMVVSLLELPGPFGHSAWAFPTGLLCAFDLANYKSIMSLVCNWLPVQTYMLQQRFLCFHIRKYFQYTHCLLQLTITSGNDVFIHYPPVWAYVLAVFVHECRRTHAMSRMRKLEEGFQKSGLPPTLFIQWSLSLISARLSTAC